MTTERDFDRIAAAWLADGPDELSDGVLDAVVDEIHLTRQRRALRAPWRFPAMTTISRIAVAAVIGVLALGGTLFVLRPTQPSIGGGNVSPSAGRTDGVWETCPTAPEIRAAGGSASEAAGNAGCTTLTLRDGVFSETGASASTTVPGTYVISGDRITIRRSNGEIFDFKWTVAGDTLTFKKSPVRGATSPAPWLAKPFQRTGV